MSQLSVHVHCQGWSYDNQADWPSKYPACGGFRQSPINIISRKVVFNGSLELLFNGYYRRMTSYSVVNTGRTVKFDFKGDLQSSPSIAGSALPDSEQQYYLKQFHFHWNRRHSLEEGSGGSEHQLDGFQFDMELHLVHSLPASSSDSSSYSKDKSGTTVVLAVLFQINQQNEVSLRAVMRSLKEVKSKPINETVPIQYGIRLSDLLPEIKDGVGFFTYTGSLTTPPCTEGITWFVLTYPKFIGFKQINEFHTLPGFENKNTFRAIQKLNGRIVQMTK